MSALEFNGSYKKITSLDFPTVFQGSASKAWIPQKVTGPKGKGLMLQSVKHLLSICPMLGTTLEVFHTHFPLNSHCYFRQGVLNYHVRTR